MVYLIVCEENQTCKIGYSYDNAKNRLQALRCASPYDIELKYWIHGDANDEKRIHEMFSAYRIKREWFSLNDEILRYFSERSADFVSEEHLYIPEPKNENDYTQVTVMVTEKMKKQYRSHDLSLMLFFGEKIYTAEKHIRDAVMDYYNLMVSSPPKSIEAIHLMIKLAIDMQTDIAHKDKQIDDLLEVLNIQEISDIVDAHAFDLISLAE